jgi:predicted nucleic acid-binding protein
LRARRPLWRGHSCPRATDLGDAIQPAFDALLGIVDEVLDVTRTAAERAKEIVLGHRRLSARDAVHLAVMEQHGISQILSFDSGFDGFPGIVRLS